MPSSSESIRAELQRKMDAILSPSSTPHSSGALRQVGPCDFERAKRSDDCDRRGQFFYDCTDVDVGRRAKSRQSAALDPETSHDPDKAYRKLLAFVSLRERSCEQTRKRLMESGFTEEVSLQAVERGRACGLLDDARFADTLIRSRLAQGRGSCCIARELVENAIDPDCIPGWPDEYLCAFDDELARALDLLKRKPPTAKNKREAAYRRLVQKGFSSAVAAQASRTWYEAFCRSS